MLFLTKGSLNLCAILYKYGVYKDQQILNKYGVYKDQQIFLKKTHIIKFHGNMSSSGGGGASKFGRTDGRKYEGYQGAFNDWVDAPKDGTLMLREKGALIGGGTR
jgi:hypothetical protein